MTDIMIGRTRFRDVEQADQLELAAMRRAFKWQRLVVMELLIRAKIAKANNGPNDIIRAAHEEYCKYRMAQAQFKHFAFPAAMARLGTKFKTLGEVLQRRLVIHPQ